MIKLFRQSSITYPLIAGMLFSCVSLLSLTAFAGVPKPEIPKGKGDQCVEDTDFMRSDHMSLLLHQRDETMYKGIRAKKHSLKECISCHVVKGDDHKPVNISNPKHFCRECHDYASVKIDCFECHASKPRPAKMVKTRNSQKFNIPKPTLMRSRAQTFSPSDKSNPNYEPMKDPFNPASDPALNPNFRSSNPMQEPAAKPAGETPAGTTDVTGG